MLLKRRNVLFSCIHYINFCRSSLPLTSTNECSLNRKCRLEQKRLKMLLAFQSLISRFILDKVNEIKKASGIEIKALLLLLLLLLLLFISQNSKQTIIAPIQMLPQYLFECIRLVNVIGFEGDFFADLLYLFRHSYKS